MKKSIILIILLILILGGVGCFLLYEYTELFGKKLIPLKINQIEIQYIPGYDIGSGEQFNTSKETVIEIQTISLKGNELKQIKRELKKIKKSSQKNEELYEVNYKLVINDSTILKIGNEVGDIQEGDKYTPITIPSSMIQTIDEIVLKNDKKVLKTISSENVVIKLDGASITIKNKDNLQYINDYLEYYPIHITEDYKKYDGGYKMILMLDNNTRVYLFNEKIGYISQKEGETDTSTFGIFPNDLYGLINEIYETSISK